MAARTAEKCGRSAASGSAPNTFGTHCEGAEERSVLHGFLRSRSKIFRHYVLTFGGSDPYIAQIRRAVRVTARLRAFEAPHYQRQGGFRPGRRLEALAARPVHRGEGRLW